MSTKTLSVRYGEYRFHGVGVMLGSRMHFIRRPFKTHRYFLSGWRQQGLTLRCAVLVLRSRGMTVWRAREILARAKARFVEAKGK